MSIAACRFFSSLVGLHNPQVLHNLVLRTIQPSVPASSPSPFKRTPASASPGPRQKREDTTLEVYPFPSRFYFLYLSLSLYLLLLYFAPPRFFPVPFQEDSCFCVSWTTPKARDATPSRFSIFCKRTPSQRCSCIACIRQKRNVATLVPFLRPFQANPVCSPYNLLSHDF